jgi:hypothetical protein
VLNKIKRALANPSLATYTLRARLDPRRLMRRYAQLARKAGFKRLYLVLSFDCDTVDDANVAWDVHARLLDMGIKPVYAVPGQLLEKGAEVYARIRDAGGEFMNHGYTEHTYFDTARGEHASCFFYDELPLEQVREDIVRGDACVKQVLGIQPRGFRTPHFGSFQKPRHLRFLHSVLRELGYRYSTSTSPLFAFRYGPAFNRYGVRELPVSGMASSPLKILDTWGCFRAPGRTLTPDDYFAEGIQTAATFSELGAGLLNYYADPSHIHDSTLFFDTVARWAAVAKPVNYQDLFEELAWNAS